jgi:hypothetical protein
MSEPRAGGALFSSRVRGLVGVLTRSLGVRRLALVGYVLVVHALLALMCFHG